MKLYLSDGNNRRERQTGILVKLVCTGMLTVGILSSFLTLFQTASPLWPAVVVSYAAAGLFLWLFRRKNGVLTGVGCLVFLAVLSQTVFHHSLTNGCIYLWNCAANVIGENSPLHLQQYDLVNEQSLHLDLILTTGLLAAVLSCVISLIQKAHWWCLYLLLLLPCAGVCLYLQRMPSSCSLLLLVAGILLNGSCLFYEGRRMRRMKNRYGMALCAAGGISLVVCVTAAVLILICPKTGYHTPALSQWISQRVSTQVDQIRYKKKFVNTLPKGDLTEGGSWETSDATALEITMEDASPLYLKGYTGGIYDLDHWEELSCQVAWQSRDLFYWLSEDEFTAQTQLWQVRSLLQDDTLAAEEKTLQVENQNADSEYLYLPYELTGQPDTASSIRQVADGGAGTWGIFGQRSYTCSTCDNLVKDFPQMAAQLYLEQRKDSRMQYPKDESYYNAFVYQQYTNLPDLDRRLLEEELGYDGKKEQGHISYASAIKKIRTYLTENITYSTQAGDLQEGQDFLSWFLTESRVGHSVQYATAAALMFRYYGIPARYVEGYLLTPERIEAATDTQTIELTGEQGHAWTEIYVDTLGWVPIEVTPDDSAGMPQPDLNRGLQADSTVIAKEPQTQQDEALEDHSKTLQELLRESLINLGKLLLILLLLFDMFCILFLLYVVLRRVMANRKRRKLFADRDNTQAVRSQVAYISGLLEWKHRLSPSNQDDTFQLLKEQYSEELALEYQKAYRIGQKAVFGRHEPDSTERSVVERCRRELLEEIKKREGWYGRWIMRYIVRLY